MKFKSLISTVCAAALAPVVVTGVAHAQGAVSAVGAEEIVVTARKRGEENVQDVPLAVTAFGAAQLDALNFQDLQTLSYTMPNVQLEDVGTLPGYANFSIRGLGINSSIPSLDPAVGVFVDGVYMGIPAGLVFDNFDMAGIEVLRGPQGVLFGRNVTGGAVLVRTTAPSDIFEFRGRVGAESGMRYYGDAMVTGPISESFSGKLAVYYSDDEGWFDNDNFDGASVGESRQTIIRPALRFTPNDTVDLILRLEHGELEGDGPVSQNHAVYDRNSYDFALDEPGFQDDSWNQMFLEGNFNVPFGNGTITNIFGWRDYESSSLIDVDGQVGLGLHAGAYFEQDQISEELRYAGTFGAWDLTAGLYYFEQDLFYIEHRTTFLSEGTGGGVGEFSTAGAFVAADWHINPQFALNFGVRYTHEEKEARVQTYAADVGSVAYDARMLTPNFSDSDEWSDISPRVGFQYTPNPDTQLYGYWARGFRSGGYNFRQVQTLGAVTPGPFDSEEQSSFELGWKQDFAEGRGRVNFAVFHNEIDQMQREINTALTFYGINQQIVNAGDATIQGAEVEARWRFTDNLLATVQAGYTDGEYDSVTFDLNTDGVVNAADAALDIPRLSPWTYGATVIHDLPLGSWGGLSTRLSYSHRDETAYTDSNLGYFNEVDLFDLSFSLAPNEGPWSLSIYGNNLTEETTYGGDTILPDLAAFGGDGALGPRPLPTFSPLNRGRVIGASLRVTY